MLLKTSRKQKFVGEFHSRAGISLTTEDTELNAQSSPRSAESKHSECHLRFDKSSASSVPNSVASVVKEMLHQFAVKNITKEKFVGEFHSRAGLSLTTEDTELSAQSSRRSIESKHSENYLRSDKSSAISVPNSVTSVVNEILHQFAVKNIEKEKIRW